MMIGAVLGWLIYTGPLVIPGIAPALSAGPVAGGLLGVLGWLVGAFIHLFQILGPVSPYELRAAVTADSLPAVEGALVDAGALEVLVSGDGAAQPAASGADSHHH